MGSCRRTLTDAPRSARVCDEVEDQGFVEEVADDGMRDLNPRPFDGDEVCKALNLYSPIHLFLS